MMGLSIQCQYCPNMHQFLFTLGPTFLVATFFSGAFLASLRLDVVLPRCSSLFSLSLASAKASSLEIPSLACKLCFFADFFLARVSDFLGFFLARAESLMRPDTPVPCIGVDFRSHGLALLFFFIFHGSAHLLEGQSAHFRHLSRAPWR